MATKRKLMATIKQTYLTSTKYLTDELEIRAHIDSTIEPYIKITTHEGAKDFVFCTKLTRKNMQRWVMLARLIEEVANDHMPEKDDETPF